MGTLGDDTQVEERGGVFHATFDERGRLVASGGAQLLCQPAQ